MKKEDKIEVAPEVVAFFDLVVSEAFTTIKSKHLNNSAFSKTRIDTDSAELFIFHDPESKKRGFHYILQFQDEILWRRSYYTNWMGETPDIDNELVSDDYSETTAEFIVVDFVTEYREDWPTKPLGEPPAES